MDVQRYKCTQRGEADTFYMDSARTEKKEERRLRPSEEKVPGAPTRLEKAEGEQPLKALGFHWLWTRLPLSLKEKQNIFGGS